MGRPARPSNQDRRQKKLRYRLASKPTIQGEHHTDQAHQAPSNAQEQEASSTDTESEAPQEPEESFETYVQGNWVIVAKAKRSDKADEAFPATPEDVLASRLKSFNFREPFRKDEKFVAGLSHKDHEERLEDVVNSFRQYFHQIPPVKITSAKANAPDFPNIQAYDFLTGWNTLFPTSPFGASPEAFMPFAVRQGALCYHTRANIAVTMWFLNWAKGRTWFILDLVIGACYQRVSRDFETPWDQRLPVLQWLTVAAENLTVARPLLGLANTKHHVRQKKWAEITNEDLEMILETVSTGRKTRLLKEKLAEARRDNTALLSIPKQPNRSVNNVSNQAAARIQQDCLAIFKSYDLSEIEFNTYMLLDGVVCPFHISCYNQLRSLGYTIGILQAILVSSPFYNQCNLSASRSDLYEIQLGDYWERLLYIVIHDVSQRVAQAVEEVRKRRPGEDRYSSPDFILEVQWLITDRQGFPIVPFEHSPFRHALATRGPPNSAMFSGYQRGNDGGHLYLPTEGPVKHPDPFDPVKSFRNEFRGVAWDSNITNTVMGSSDPLFWPAQFACLSQIPTSGPFWKIDSALGRERWALPGEHLETKAPDSSFPPDLNLPDPRYAQLMEGQDQPLSFRCPHPDCPSSNLDAGQYQYHLNRFHSNWRHRCQSCQRVFSDQTALKAHSRINSCLNAEGVLDKAHDFFREYLYCDHVDCLGKRKRYRDLTNLDQHYQSQHIPLEKQSPPTMICECGFYWTSDIDRLRQHQASNFHQQRMENRSKPNQGLSQKYQCQVCYIETQREDRWKRHQDSDRHKRNVFYSSLEGKFKRIDENAIQERRAGQVKASRSQKDKDSWIRYKTSWDRGLHKRAKSDDWKAAKFTCEACKYGFKYIRDITYHLNTPEHEYRNPTSILPSPRKYPCLDCNFSTNISYRFNEHRRQRHNKMLKPESAPSDLAGKVKKLSKKLRDILSSDDGIPTDLGDKVCPACLRSFRWDNDRQLHRSTGACYINRDTLQSIDIDLSIAHAKVREFLRGRQESAGTVLGKGQASASQPSPQGKASGKGKAGVAARQQLNSSFLKPTLKRQNSNDDYSERSSKRQQITAHRRSSRLAALRPRSSSMSPLVQEVASDDMDDDADGADSSEADDDFEGDDGSEADEGDYSDNSD